ncbi:MAG: type II toxin-antitoxin system VapB family antitoxin [Pseudomonadales bacterium]|jgi:Arc/MetJ family transcription regulator|nr:type II toxin-antitoxin system VapB family antitoxin [Pseudomonadales bacterium]
MKLRTNIVLDDDLVKEAQALSQIKTKRELVEVALREFVDNRKRMDLRELRGVADLRADYDYKSTRQVKEDQ